MKAATKVLVEKLPRGRDATADFAGRLAHQGVDDFKDRTPPEWKAIRNLKYCTWVEQQRKTCEEQMLSGIPITGGRCPRTRRPLSIS